MQIQTSYGFPKTDPSAALAVAYELAARHNGGARRLHEDGSIDVAVVEKGQFDLYLVAPDGTATLVESTPPPWQRGVGKVSIGVGIVLAVTAVAWVMIAAGRGDEEPGRAGVLFVLGWLAAMAGGITVGRRDLDWHLKRRFGDTLAWKPILERSAWSPRTLAQLAAVEGLADRDGDQALVRELPAGAVEAATMKRGRIFRHRVAENGAVTPMETLGRGRLYAVGTAVAMCGLLGFVGVFAALLLDDAQRLILAGVSLAVIVLGGILRGRDELEARMPRIEPGMWHLVRTKPENTGGD